MALSDLLRRSPMLFIMPQVNASVNCPLRLTHCFEITASYMAFDRKLRVSAIAVTQR
ncbi:hypothetical protein [Calothrix sp. NIES-2098]|uniref:hypothetical protein n=1 Tax=Calothrix sp. NIES-2098 TaxID=1954171 RepID=UPI0030D96D0A